VKPEDELPRTADPKQPAIQRAAVDKVHATMEKRQSCGEEGERKCEVEQQKGLLTRKSGKEGEFEGGDCKCE
jgi:hypothetical protein